MHHLFEFLSSCKPLRSLSIVAHSLSEKGVILQHHGPTLRKLCLGSVSPLNGPRTREHLCEDELAYINTICPVLEEIKLNVFCSATGSSEYACLVELGKFKGLSIVAFGMESSQFPSEQSRHPFAVGSPDLVENIWSVLEDEKRKNGSVRLRELHVIVRGGVEDKVYLKYVAVKSVRDDREGAICIMKTLEDGTQAHEWVWVPEREDLVRTEKGHWIRKDDSLDLDPSPDGQT